MLEGWFSSAKSCARMRERHWWGEKSENIRGLAMGELVCFFSLVYILSLFFFIGDYGEHIKNETLVGSHQEVTDLRKIYGRGVPKNYIYI